MDVAAPAHIMQQTGPIEIESIKPSSGEVVDWITILGVISLGALVGLAIVGVGTRKGYWELSRRRSRSDGQH